MSLHNSPIQQTFPTGKFSPCSIRPWIYKGSWSIVPCILRQHYTEVCGQIHALLLVGPQNSPSNHSVRLSGPLSQSGHCGRQKDFLILPGTEPWYSGHPVCGRVTLLNDLSWSHIQENKVTELTHGNALLKIKPATKWVTLIPSTWQA